MVRRDKRARSEQRVICYTWPASCAKRAWRHAVRSETEGQSFGGGGQNTAPCPKPCGAPAGSSLRQGCALVHRTCRGSRHAGKFQQHREASSGEFPGPDDGGLCACPAAVRCWGIRRPMSASRAPVNIRLQRPSELKRGKPLSHLERGLRAQLECETVTAKERESLAACTAVESLTRWRRIVADSRQRERLQSERERMAGFTLGLSDGKYSSASSSLSGGFLMSTA